MTSDLTDTIEVVTPRGTVRGLTRDRVQRFAGIPFARTTAGDGRFRPPVPHGGWDDVLDATGFAAVSPQNPSMMDALFGGEAERWDEDCLHLNVWTPALTGDGPLPVMVWIHGGGFEMGSGSSPIYHGESFARSDVVCVSINYRLGSLGFLELGHLDPAFAGSGNTGLLDQIEALRWVRENISSFGGDPGNVTIFGESAGAMSVSALLTMPLAQGLYHKAIAQSGALSAATDPEAAAATADEFLACAGIDSVDRLVAAPVTDLLAAHAKMSAERLTNPENVIRRYGSPLAFLAFRPVADGRELPLDPLGEVVAGRTGGVPLLVGTNREEWNLFALMTPPSADRDALAERVRLLGVDPDTVISAYEADHPGSSVAEIESAVFTDYVFRVPASRLADAQARHAPVWQYRFDWPSPAMGGALGAAHAVEIPFVFDMVSDKRLHVMLGADAPAELATDMHGAWVAFARDGAPHLAGIDWPRSVEGTRSVVCFDTETSVHVDPGAKSLRCWPD